MDLYALDAATFNPDDLVEGWTSLIWTERFQEAGDFQLKTPMIAETMAAIPEDSFVAIKESQEIMVVENHSIAFNEEGVEELTTTGRSIAAWLLENRYHYGDPGQPWDPYKQYSYHDAVAMLIWNHVVNTSTLDITGSPLPHDPAEGCGTVMVHDQIWDQSGVAASNPLSPYYLRDWTLSNGEVWKTCLDWLKLGNLGLRVDRPVGSALTYSMATTFSTLNDATKGQVYHANEYHYEKLDFCIYSGGKRTKAQSILTPAVQPVVFRYDAGHILTPTYLRSAKGFKNVCRVVSTAGDRLVLGQPSKPTGAGTDWTGYNRRGMILDLGDVSGADVADITKYLDQEGAIALNNANIQTLAEGAISPMVPYKFGTDYGLGDIVTVAGRYGVQEDMRVIEYVRSQDQDGFRAFPSLVHILT